MITDPLNAASAKLIAEACAYVLNDTIDLSVLLSWVSRLTSNQFGMWRGVSATAPIADFLHLNASYINHRYPRNFSPNSSNPPRLTPRFSCLPNCYVDWDDKILQIKSLVPIREAEELCIAYLFFEPEPGLATSQSINKSSAARRLQLKEKYQFDCACQRCSGSSKQRQEAEEYFDFWLCCPTCRRGLLKPDPPDPDEPAEPGMDLRSCTSCHQRFFREEAPPPLPQK
jgi:hypothetical protein